MKPCPNLSCFAALLISLIHAAEPSCWAQFAYVTNSGTVTITGISGTNPVVVPDTIDGLPVTSIGTRAFYDQRISQLILPTTLTNIGSYAFSFSGLLSLAIPDSVLTVGDYSLYQCRSLTDLTVGAGLTNIGDGSFAGCLGLLAIDVSPDNSTFSSMDGVLFDKAQKTLVKYPCGRSGAYAVPNTVAALRHQAFLDCGRLAEVSLPDGLLLIDDESFENCTSLAAVTIPNTVTNIGYFGFADCKALTSIALPDSVQYLGSRALGFCYALTNVTIGKGLAGMGTWPFYFCKGLLCIDVDPLNAVYSSVDGVMFDRSRTALIAFPDGRRGSYTVPYGVTTIASWAFGSCGLSSVTMPTSLVLIQGAAFNSSYDLGEVYFLGNAPTVTWSSYSTFGTTTTLYYLPGTTGWGPSIAYRPTAPWVLSQPMVLDGTLGVNHGSFGFIVSWASNATVAVEACTNLTSPVWTESESQTLTNGFWYFGDSDLSNHSSRFYRLRSP